MTKSLNKGVIFLLLVTLVFAGVFGAACATDPQRFALADDAVYGGKRASELWYFGASYLNLDGLKSEIADWDLTKADRDNPVVIAVVDTGVNVGHNLFTTTNTILKNKDNSVNGYNSYYAANSANPTATQLRSIEDNTDNSHGTAVAGIMAILIGELGLSDYIKLLPIKASNSATPPSNYTSEQKSDYYRSFSSASVIKALEYVSSTKDTVGVDVVNLSLTGYDEKDWNSQAMQKAVGDASANATIVAAAGNGDKTATTGYATSVKKGYPASVSGALSVMGYQAGGTKYASSNYGDYDVIAPGQNIYTAKGSSTAYQNISGTSMACAFVSVTAALLRLRDGIAVAGSDTPAVPAGKIANHIRTTATSYIRYIDGSTVYDLPKHSMLESVSSAFDESYVEPRGIAVNDEGIFTDGKISMIADNVKTINLTANLTPYGATNPIYDAEISWYLVQIGVRNQTDENGEELETTEEYEMSRALVGKGKTLSYTPNAAGTYALRAEFVRGSETYFEDRRFTYVYQDYSAIANSVRVVLKNELDSIQPSNEASQFTSDKLTFTLNCVNYVDPTTETKWFINGEYAGSGAEFVFYAKKAGSYVVTAQYGDYQKVEKTFMVTVSHSISRPESIISLSVFGAALAIVAVACSVAAVKRKNREKNA